MKKYLPELIVEEYVIKRPVGIDYDKSERDYERDKQDNIKMALNTIDDVLNRIYNKHEYLSGRDYSNLVTAYRILTEHEILYKIHPLKRALFLFLIHNRFGLLNNMVNHNYRDLHHKHLKTGLKI